MYTKQCHPTGRAKRVNQSKRQSDLLLSRGARSSSTKKSDLLSALNLHNRIDEEVCRIAWVNEASTDTCAFDFSRRDTKSQNRVTNPVHS